MKKLLSCILVISIVTCLGLGFTGCDKIAASKLEEEIVGTWVSPEIGEVTFNADGSFSGTLPFEIMIDVEGVYTVSSGEQIVVEFYYADEFHQRILGVELDDDELSISYFMEGTSGVYSRK